jgi:hypothetical protein
VSDCHDDITDPLPPTRTPALVTDRLMLDPTTVTLVLPVLGPFVITMVLTAIDAAPA